MFENKKYLRFYIIIGVMVLLREATARPGRQSEYPSDATVVNKCNEDDQHVIEVCQRCAKQTKSPIVYPMCCENDEDVFNWCDKYVNYGIQA